MSHESKTIYYYNIKSLAGKICLVILSYNLQVNLLILY